MRIRVGHLYPDQLNIYADRGNIAVLDGARGRARPRARGDADRARRRACRNADLFYVGGGQDREQALVAPDLAAKGAGAARGRRRAARRSSRSAAATSCSAASTATAPAPSCPASACCRCTRSPASGG